MRRTLPRILGALILVGAALVLLAESFFEAPGEFPGPTDSTEQVEIEPGGRSPTKQPASGRAEASEVEHRTPSLSAIGFRSQRTLDEHFEKHGREFGAITKDEYLRRACELRDAEVGGSVLEIVRDDGVHSRFDTRSGAFLAFGRDRVIRTFFKPNDGRRYFERQADKEHE